MATIEINKSGGDPPYSTIASAIAVSDVSSSSCILEITDNSEYDESFTLAPNAGSTTATNYLELRAAVGNRHSGVYGADHARIKTTSTGDCIIVGADNVYIRYLQIEQATTGAPGVSLECIDWTNRTNVLVSHCIFKANGATGQDAIYTQHAATQTGTLNIYIDHCVFQDINRAAISLQNWSNSVSNTHTLKANVDYCTAYNINSGNNTQHGGFIAMWAYDSQVTTDAQVYNCAAHKSQANCNVYHEHTAQRNGTNTWGGSDNIATDTSCESKFGAANSFDSVTFTINPVSGENIHLASVTADYDFTIDGEDGSLTVSENGLDREESEPHADQDFGTDIAGNSRTAESVISIGAFEFVTAGGASPEPWIHRRRHVHSTLLRM